MNGSDVIKTLIIVKSLLKLNILIYQKHYLISVSLKGIKFIYSFIRLRIICRSIRYQIIILFSNYFYYLETINVHLWSIIEIITKFTKSCSIVKEVKQNN